MTARPFLRPAAFRTTHWTCVCEAQSGSEDGRAALAELCDAYYEPVLAFLRCELRDADSARDMSHAFFAEMLGNGSIGGADRTRGRFRSYLLGAVKHFLARQRESAARMKRGGGLEALSLDHEEAVEVADARQGTPDAEFDRQWAVTVLARGLEALHLECIAENRETFFESVKPLLMGDGAYGDQAALAAACGMNLDAFRMAVHRLKKRLRQCVKAEVAGTLDDPAMVQEEMQSLFAALGG
ncbi:MAG: sigma-70 family RNA polymerase sigma factor [Prosthecobacter sp.]